MNMIKDVRKFMLACDQEILDKPKFPDMNTVMLRQMLVKEEVVEELFESLRARDIVGVADAIADSIYVLIGMAHAFGIPLEKVWNAVQAANMAKVDSVTGKVTRREDGKILKPEGWKPPDIASIIEEQPF